MSRNRSSVAACWLAVMLVLLVFPALASDDRDIRAILNEAKSRARDIPGQAEALVRLAWPQDGSTDPRVQAAARKELIEFGNYALTALRGAITRVDPLYSSDVVSTLIEARHKHRSGNPSDFLPALEEAIWFGSVEARRLAMLEIPRFAYPPALLTTMDAIYENPELTMLGLRTLGRMRDKRARYFLSRVLDHGDPRYKVEAARSLGQVGDAGRAALRARLTSETQSVREASIDALLPFSTPEDLTSLHEYVFVHADDDASIVERVRARAIELEEILEEQQLSEAASAEPEEEPDP